MIGLIFALIFLNGLFVAAEFALVRLHAAPTHRFQQGKGWRARLIRRMLGNLDAYLSTAQIGITSTSIALGSVGEPYVAAILQEKFAAVFPGVAELAPGVSFALSLTLITTIQIIIGEQAPKSYGIKAYELVSGWTAPVLQALYLVAYPLIWLINNASLVLVRLFGVEPEHGIRSLSEDDLRVLLLQSMTGGAISERERHIMVNAMRLAEREAVDVMVPRPDVTTIDAEATVAEARRLIVETGHSRIPVVDPDLDHCVGILYAKDLLKPGIENDTPVAHLVREPLFVPETSSLERLLYFFQTRGQHMAIVIDEFGGASGIVTLEDVLEELVGEIQDEYDRVTSPQLRKIGERQWRASGMIRLEEVADALGVEFDSDQDTLSGWFTAQIDRFPRRGDTVVWRGFRFRVESVDGHRVASMLIDRLPDTASEVR